MKPAKKYKIVIVVVLIVGVLAGRLSVPRHSHDDGDRGAPTDAAPTEYTCSMHPQIRQPNPGKCPICAMDLIPAASGKNNQQGEREVSLSPHARALARIQTQVVERVVPEAEVRLLGRVMADESRVRSVTARFPARIERLYVNYTGVRVQEGDHLAQIYSPELLTAQAELLSGRRFDDARAMRGARDKLILWGLSEEAVAEVEARGEPSDRMDIDSPLGGFVTTKKVNDGDYVDTGTVMFQITDLSTVWVVLDAYEMDKPWLRFGQAVSFTAEAVPGKTFEGRVAFIAPVLDPVSRTFKVRVNVKNSDLMLRPGMFVTATVKARLAAGGVVLDPELKGKWISPMHPEIVKDGPGPCDVCGMDLVPAEDFGYLVTETEPPLIVPATAVLRTGRRAVVYVELPDRDEPVYEGREIVLGPRAGDVYLVASGLEEGERVVVNGAFKLDSTLQLQAKPSMMSAQPEGKDSEAVVIDASPPMREALAAMLEVYFPVWRALAGDDLEKAREGAVALERATHQHHGLAASGKARDFWEDALASVGREAMKVSKAETIDDARRDFEPLANTLIGMVRAVGLPEEQREEVELAYCPMTFEGRRADWLQKGSELLNPYFGAAMLRCGDFEPIPEPPTVSLHQP